MRPRQPQTLCVDKAGLELLILLGIANPTGITNVYHHAWLLKVVPRA